jgi:Uma2 family endonuclease
MVALRDRLFMTVDEYFAWEETQDEKHEYWDGEVIVGRTVTKNYSRIALNMCKHLETTIHNGICEVFISAIKIELEAQAKYFYPDVVVTCDDREDNDFYIKYPCLIIDIEKIDYGTRFTKYRQMPTLKEYVVIKVTEPRLEIYRRINQNQWILSDHEMDDRILLESVNVEISVSDLYRQVKFEPMEEPGEDCEIEA